VRDDESRWLFLRIAVPYGLIDAGKDGVDSGMAGVGTMNENGTVPRKDI
jgi:hypothetical protein